MTKFKELKKVVAQLRAQDGCDWDRKQTLHSLQPYLLEETYEVLNAIDMRDNQNLKGELGDLLFVILLMTQIASETDAFDIEDVIHEITKKMVQRHPDVFPSQDTAEMFSKSWEQRKTRERSRNTSVLDGIPEALPSLLSAYRITEKASGIGFDWPDYAPVRENLMKNFKKNSMTRMPPGMQQQLNMNLGTSCLL